MRQYVVSLAKSALRHGAGGLLQGMVDAACPNNEQTRLPCLYLSKSILSTRKGHNSYDLHTLRERVALRRRFRQHASRL
jgi:hypothetical protein